MTEEIKKRCPYAPECLYEGTLNDVNEHMVYAHRAAASESGCIGDIFGYMDWATVAVVAALAVVVGVWHWADVISETEVKKEIIQACADAESPKRCSDELRGEP